VWVVVIEIRVTFSWEKNVENGSSYNRGDKSIILRWICHGFNIGAEPLGLTAVSCGVLGNV